MTQVYRVSWQRLGHVFERWPEKKANSMSGGLVRRHCRASSRDLLLEMSFFTPRGRSFLLVFSWVLFGMGGLVSQRWKHTGMGPQYTNVHK